MTQIESDIAAILSQLPASTTQKEIRLTVEIPNSYSAVDIIILGVLVGVTGIVVGITLATALT